jgi:hypothetical protein
VLSVVRARARQERRRQELPNGCWVVGWLVGWLGLGLDFGVALRFLGLAPRAKLLLSEAVMAGWIYYYFGARRWGLPSSDEFNSQIHSYFFFLLKTKEKPTRVSESDKVSIPVSQSVYRIGLISEPNMVAASRTYYPANEISSAEA